MTQVDITPIMRGAAGIWQCAPGPSHWTLTTNEVNLPRRGVPTGWTGTWHIQDTVRKVYSIF
ncbi:hypothetical protein [Mycolicibacterium mengxianglii]|uniref:hypothetical protein n=1 Tax=Mycolicibacterium mengxianglii TaxID=2736649 RepID=UPI0018D0A860|nr:hypothetical protein [Mycolicibacterium mengxianglii]